MPHIQHKILTKQRLAWMLENKHLWIDISCTEVFGNPQLPAFMKALQDAGFYTERINDQRLINLILEAKKAIREWKSKGHQTSLDASHAPATVDDHIESSFETHCKVSRYEYVPNKNIRTLITNALDERKKHQS